MTRWSDHVHDVLPALLLIAVASGPPPTHGATMNEPTPTHLTDAGDGIHLHPDHIAAAYTLGPHEPGWVDMPEARPRARGRATEPVTVVIDTDGGLHHPAGKVEIDTYQGDEYAAVRAEGEARWAAIDAAAGER